MATQVVFLFFRYRLFYLTEYQTGGLFSERGWLLAWGGRENSPQTALLPQVMLVSAGPCAVRELLRVSSNS